jgi:hypothetical protein
MTVTRISATAISQTSNIVPVQSIMGGTAVIVFSLSGMPYKLIGFTAGFFPTRGAAGAGPTSLSDGRVKVPCQIVVPPSYDPIVYGELELLYFQQNAPPTIAIAAGILGYAKLDGVIPPGISVINLIFSFPNDAELQANGSNPTLILDDCSGGNV